MFKLLSSDPIIVNVAPSGHFETFVPTPSLHSSRLVESMERFRGVERFVPPGVYYYNVKRVGLNTETTLIPV